MIAGLDKAHALALSQNSICLSFEPIQISLRNQSCPRVGFDQLPQSVDSVADNSRELLPRDTENVASLFSWEPIIEYARFFWTFHVSLKDKWRRHPVEISFSLFE